MMKKLDTHTQFITTFDGEIRVLSYFIRGDFGGGEGGRGGVGNGNISVGFFVHRVYILYDV